MIDDICKVDTFLHEKFNYVGTLRNQYKFNIEDDVFFSPIGTNDIHRGKIVGVERLESLNAEYLYKVAFCGKSNQPCFSWLYFEWLCLVGYLRGIFGIFAPFFERARSFSCSFWAFSLLSSIWASAMRVDPFDINLDYLLNCFFNIWFRSLGLSKSFQCIHAADHLSWFRIPFDAKFSFDSSHFIHIKSIPLKLQTEY